MKRQLEFLAEVDGYSSITKITEIAYDPLREKQTTIPYIPLELLTVKITFVIPRALTKRMVKLITEFAEVEQ